VVVVAEGAKFSADTDPQHGALIVTELSKDEFGHARLGGIGTYWQKKSNGIPDLKRARWYWSISSVAVHPPPGPYLATRYGMARRCRPRRKVW